MKIIVDGFGGDNAPGEIVKACVLALEEFKDLEIIITGQSRCDFLRSHFLQGMP